MRGTVGWRLCSSAAILAMHGIAYLRGGEVSVRFARGGGRDVRPTCTQWVDDGGYRALVEGLLGDEHAHGLEHLQHVRALLGLGGHVVYHDVGEDVEQRLRLCGVLLEPPFALLLPRRQEGGGRRSAAAV